MSNPVSLHVEAESVCLAELGDQDVLDCERDPNLKDYLKDADSDMYTLELSELYRAKGDALRFQPSDRLLKIILWSWIDESENVCDLNPEQAEELGLDLAMSAASIQTLAPVIQGFDPTGVASTIFGPNELWKTESDLAEYLSHWSKAFSDALNENKGLYYKIWV